MITNWFLPIYFMVCVSVAFVFPGWRVYKQTAFNLITFCSGNNSQDYVGKMFRLIIGIMLLVIILFIVSAGLYVYLLPASYLEDPIVKWVGISLCVLSLIRIALPQLQMSTSWRIGIDEHHKTELKQHSFFSISRNQICFGMLVSLLGVFFFIPNAVSLVVLVTAFLLIQIRVKLEEEFLEKQHDENYLVYKTKIRRFI